MTLDRTVSERVLVSEEGSRMTAACPQKTSLLKQTFGATGTSISSKLCFATFASTAFSPGLATLGRRTSTAEQLRDTLETSFLTVCLTFEFANSQPVTARPQARGSRACRSQRTRAPQPGKDRERRDRTNAKMSCQRPLKIPRGCKAWTKLKNI